MASNPYVNKVQKADGTTIMDISSDTVTPSDVLSGVTFHDRSGAAQQGSLITHNVYDGLDSDSSTDALSAKQGKLLNSKLAKYEAYKDAYLTSDVLALALSENNNLITYFGSDASNKPTTQGGVALYLPMRGSMKIVIFFEALGHVYSNTYFNNAWSGWLKLTP